MYANMKTIATVCNGIPECDDASDENCKENNLSNILLGSTFGGVLLLYLGLKLSRAMYRKFFKSKKMQPAGIGIPFSCHRLLFRLSFQETKDGLNR